MSRFAKMKVIASMQGIHCTSDMAWVPTRIGKQRAKEGAYPWKTLTDSGALVVNGSDTPVEPVNPLLGYYATVTRMDRKGAPEGGWLPEQKLTRVEALATYTKNAAIASFREKDLGTIALGKRADVVVLSKNIFQIKAAKILETKVDMTIVNGAVVFDRLNEKNVNM